MERTNEQRRRLVAIASAIEAEPHRWNQFAHASAPREWTYGLLRMEDTPFVLRVGVSDDKWRELSFCVAGWNWALHRADEYTSVSILGDAMYMGPDPTGLSFGEFDSIDYRELEAAARTDLGLTAREAEVMFNAFWKPREGMTAPAALRYIAAGNHVERVTNMRGIDSLMLESAPYTEAERVELAIHKATPASEFIADVRSTCIYCHRDIKRVPGGHGPTWVHSNTGAVVGGA